MTGPFGPHKRERVVIVTTDPISLPKVSTMDLVTNLPAPPAEQAEERNGQAASLEEVVRL